MRHLVRVSFFCALAVSAAFAQNDRGTITGTVTDPSGAVIAGAKVSAENVDTHSTIETVTTGTGNYTLASIPAGTWNVAVEAPGFKKFSSLKNTVEVAQALRLDARLEVGSSTETVAG